MSLKESVGFPKKKKKKKKQIQKLDRKWLWIFSFIFDGLASDPTDNEATDIMARRNWLFYLSYFWFVLNRRKKKTDTNESFLLRFLFLEINLHISFPLFKKKKKETERVWETSGGAKLGWQLLISRRTNDLSLHSSSSSSSSFLILL